MKKRQNRPETPDPPSQTPPSATPQQSPASHGSPQVSGGRPFNTLLNATGPKTYISGSPTAPKVRDTPTAVASPGIKARPSCKADTATVSVAPSPGNRMLQQAMDHRRELARHPDWPGTTLAGSGPLRHFPGGRCDCLPLRHPVCQRAVPRCCAVERRCLSNQHGADGQAGPLTSGDL